MKYLLRSTLLMAALLAGGCDDVTDHDHDHDHNHGLATRVVLNFTPTDGGETLSFTWTDPNNDGNPTIDSIALPDGSEDETHVERVYELSVEVWNDLEDPAEDVTAEIEEQAEQHQLFFTGSAVEGPATGANGSALVSQEYADVDGDGLPVGLENTVTTVATGSGELVVTLRHLAPEDGEATKVAGLAETVADGGFSAIGGDTDIQVTFDLTVE